MEPSTRYVEGWVIEAICQHLEAVTFGEIKRLLINVPPGSMKSLLCNVFWPAWEWANGYGHYRTISFSYAAHLTERDNEKFRDIVTCPEYQGMFGANWRYHAKEVPGVEITKKGAIKVANSRKGFRFATSVTGVGTGERGDRVVLDDPHNVAEGESEVVRKSTVNWFMTAMSNRLNDMENSVIVVIMQRVHEEDVSGAILEANLGYTHLCIPAEYDESRHCETEIGWSDPRTEHGETFWPQRFPLKVLNLLRVTLGPYGYAGQYQQVPMPAGGGIFPADKWQLWGDPADPDNKLPENKMFKIYPTFTFVVGSFDGAFTEKQENDWSAFTVWGLWEDNGIPKVMMIRAWRERLPINGLVEKIAETAKLYRLDKVLIEAKANGHSVHQELLRLHTNAGFHCQLVDPKNLDKVARAYAVQNLFYAGLIWAPDRVWSDMVITECAQFPKGKHDDLVDTVTMALNWMRNCGLLEMAEERQAKIEMAQVLKKPLKPLYDV